MEDLSHYNPEGSQLRKAQMKMLEILDVFSNICHKHNINYWIISGTLLGAKRHGGFIPWDDDLDVAVLQSDYKKLLSILKTDLPDNLKLQSRGTDKKYWFFYSKIRDTNSRYFEEARDFEFQGIFIDIFPMEPIPFIGFKKTIDKFLFSEIHFKRARSLSNKIKYFGMALFIPIVYLIIALSRWYYKHIHRKKVYAYSYGVFFYATYNINHFFPVSEIMFEGKKYNAPRDVDNYLADNFGSDFMVLPKASNRRGHSSKIEFY